MASITAPSHFKSFTASDGTKYGYISIQPQPSKPTLLFLHGYPSSSYHWHNQIRQCIDAGYGAIAPDLLGYGDTSKPAEVSAYDNTIIAKHIIELLDHENIPIVVGIGHDWGSLFLSTFARLYAQRFSLLVFLTVAYMPSQAALTDIDAINAQSTKLIGRPVYGYWHFYNRPDAASIVESADPMSLASLSYPDDPNIWIDHICQVGGMEAWIKEKKVTKLASWVDQNELDTHAKILKAGGMTGPLNWYKQAMAGVTHNSEAKINPNYSATRFTIPTLFVGCEQDMIGRPAIQAARMQGFFDNLTVKTVNAGHWVIFEQPNELWDILHEWIEEKEKRAHLCEDQT